MYSRRLDGTPLSWASIQCRRQKAFPGTGSSVHTSGKLSSGIPCTLLLTGCMQCTNPSFQLPSRDMSMSKLPAVVPVVRLTCSVNVSIRPI